MNRAQMPSYPAAPALIELLFNGPYGFVGMRFDAFIFARRVAYGGARVAHAAKSLCNIIIGMVPRFISATSNFAGLPSTGFGRLTHLTPLGLSFCLFIHGVNLSRNHYTHLRASHR